MFKKATVDQHILQGLASEVQRCRSATVKIVANRYPANQAQPSDLLC